MSEPIPTNHQVGDLGHTVDHNFIVQVLHDLLADIQALQGGGPGGSNFLTTGGNNCVIVGINTPLATVNLPGGNRDAAVDTLDVLYGGARVFALNGYGELRAAPGLPAHAAAVFQGAPGQTGPIFQLQNSTGTVLASFSAAGAMSLAQILLQAASSSAPQLQITNIQSAPAQPPVQIVAASAGDLALGVDASGDPSNRLQINSNGRIFWGPGSSSPDTTIYRSASRQIAVDPLVANVNGVPEGWHSLGSLSGYTVNRARYRIDPRGELEIDISAGANGSNAQTTQFSVILPSSPVNYRPSIAYNLPLIAGAHLVTTGDTWPRLAILPTGVVDVLLAPNVTGSVFCNGSIPLD